jgi:hypothetical protein
MTIHLPDDMALVCFRIVAVAAASASAAAASASASASAASAAAAAAEGGVRRGLGRRYVAAGEGFRNGYAA